MSSWDIKNLSKIKINVHANQTPDIMYFISCKPACPGEKTYAILWSTRLGVQARQLVFVSPFPSLFGNENYPFFLSPPTPKQVFPSSHFPSPSLYVKWGKWNQILKKPQHTDTKHTGKTQVSHKVSLFRWSRIFIFLCRCSQISKAVLREPYTAHMLWICKLFSSHLHIKKNVFQKSLKIKAQQKRVLDKRKDNMV